MNNLTTLDEKMVDTLRSALEAHQADYPSMMDLSMVDGFLTALALMPHPESLDNVIDEVFAPDAGQALPEDPHLIELLNERFKKIQVCLQAGHGFEPIIFPLLNDDDEMILKGPEAPYAITPWSLGFYIGLQHWDDDTPEVDEAMSAILCFLTPECFEADDDSEEAKEAAATFAQALEDFQREHPVPESLDQGLYDIVKATYTFKKAISPNQPIRHEKVGRNEPCPCGSGKKYKQCCGR